MPNGLIGPVREIREEKKVLKPFAHRVFALTFAAPISSF